MLGVCNVESREALNREVINEFARLPRHAQEDGLYILKNHDLLRQVADKAGTMPPQEYLEYVHQQVIQHKRLQEVAHG